MKTINYCIASLLLGAGAFTVAACASTPDDDGGSGGMGGNGGASGGASSGGGPTVGTGGALGGQGGTGDDALFAVMYEVYEPNGDSNSYLNVLSDLDIEEVDPGLGREYAGGRAFVQTYGGKVFVGDAAAPIVTRYSVGDSGELEEEESISFANFGLTTGQFDTWNVTFLSPQKAYLMDFTEGTTIIWNPSTMTILGEIPSPEEFLREGLSFESSPAAVRDGVLYRTVNWVDYDTAEYSTDYLLVRFDTETDEIIDMVPETRCPVPGNLTYTDEVGNIYFSNWVWPVAGTIMRGAPDPCVLRINAGEDGFDPDWTFEYQDVTEGRHGAMFTYLGDGQALVSAFYEDRTSFDDETNPWDYVGSMNWRVWNVDLTTLESSPLEGLDYNAGAFTPAVLGGRQYLLVPGGAEENWATQMYEVVDGRAEARARLPGWSYQIVQVR